MYTSYKISGIIGWNIWFEIEGIFMKERVIIHSDLNNFYASVERLYHPEFRGKPLASYLSPPKSEIHKTFRSYIKKICYSTNSRYRFACYAYC